MIPIALQLYSVRDHCAKDFLGTIKRVAEMGYDGVEFAGYHGHSAAEIRATLDACGLKAVGSHTGIDQFTPETIGKVIEDHQTLGAPFPIVPWLPEEKRNTPESALATAQHLAPLPAMLAGSGLKTGFHVHDGDVKPLSDGRTAWDIIAAETGPDFLLQWDTANGMYGGADAVTALRAHPGRGLSVHLKEHVEGDAAAIIGEGDVPWAEVFEACENVAGTQVYVVEAERYADYDPLVVVEKCLANLKQMLGRS